MVRVAEKSHTHDGQDWQDSNVKFEGEFHFSSMVKDTCRLFRNCLLLVFAFIVREDGSGSDSRVLAVASLDILRPAWSRHGGGYKVCDSMGYQVVDVMKDW